MFLDVSRYCRILPDLGFMGNTVHEIEQVRSLLFIPADHQSLTPVSLLLHGLMVKNSFKQHYLQSRCLMLDR